MSNRISKQHNSKSSDRRLASGARPEAYLLSERAKALESRLSAEVIASTRTASPSPSPQLTKNNTNSNNSTNKTTEPNDWDPSHFRLFVGNLGSDVTDMILLKAFNAYPSVSKVQMAMDYKAGVNKGFGFVAFKDANDYLKAFKEVNGKYIGHHPCTLKRANDLSKSKNNNKYNKFSKRK